jgi:uncharacterized protein (TIRG00374 family)
MFKKPSTWIGIFFIFLSFFLLFHNIDKDKLLTAVIQFHYIWLLPALTIYMFGYIIRGYRWVVLLSPIKKCSFQSLFPTLMVGFMANNIFPARAGELVRAHLNGKKEGISSSASFATIVLERLFDGLTMILVLWAALLFGSLPINKDTMPSGIQHAINFSPYVFGAAFLVLFLLVIFKKLAIDLVNILISIAPKKLGEPLGKTAHTFIDGLQILQNAKESSIILITSLCAWTCEFTAYYCLAIGMDIAPSPLTLWSAALVMAIVNLGILIPSTPGGIGVFELIGVFIVTPFGIDKATAIAYMILVHLMVWIPITLLGAYFYTQEHLNINKMTSVSKTTTPKRKSKKTKVRK